jgi:pyruvate-formate lyase
MTAVVSDHDISYHGHIEALRQTKSEHTQEKIRRKGYHDSDDHGWIPWPDPVPFKATPTEPGGGCYGVRAIGENFRTWLQVHPLYIHPRSALAGAWVEFGPPGVGGWPADEQPTHLEARYRKYNVAGTGIGAGNHIGPDMRIGLDLGWGGLLAKIRRYRDLNRPSDDSFYAGEEALVLGIQEWIQRHVGHARSLAESETDPTVAQNYLEIAEMNQWLVHGAPRTLREACQFLAWFQSVDRTWGAGGALGQLDELLRPFYEADLAAGRLDDDEAVWCIASLFFNDTHYSQIGGPGPDGHDQTSAISFLVLEAMHLLKIPINIALRVHDDLNPELLHRAVQYLFEDGTGCSFACSQGLDKGYARNGIPLALARQRAKVGCNWTALPGIEYGHQDVTRMCLVAPFQYAFQDVNAAGQPPSLELLWERYTHHLGICVGLMKEGRDWHMARQGKYRPEIVLNLFMHGPIERGLDVVDGGVDIYMLAVDGLGLATVADSFAAIQRRVVDEKRLTWGELAAHLAADFSGAEDVRMMLAAGPRYGSGGSSADGWAQRVADLYSDLTRNTPTAAGYTILPGLFSHGGIAGYGRNLGATPNGRRAAAPIAHSADPDPGFMADGSAAPTAKSNAVATVQPRWGNTTPLQLDLDEGLSRQLGGVESIEALIRGHNDMGGTLINLNVISKEQILEAHGDPSLYPDLVVRVTGYSAYFRSLSPEYRQQIVDRLLAQA